MARMATIQLKVHGKLVQSIPLDQQDIECLIDGLRRVTPCTPRIDRLVDLLQQIRDRGKASTEAPGGTLRSLGWGEPGEDDPY